MKQYFFTLQTLNKEITAARAYSNKLSCETAKKMKYFYN